MRSLLTEKGIENRAPPKAGRLEIYDKHVQAMALRVTAKGAKTFVVRTRVKGETSPIRVTIGDAKVMKLADAREKAKDVIRQCEKGIDPRLQVVVPPEESTVWEDVLERFAEDHGRKRKSWGQTEALYRTKVTPYWTGKDISEITRADVITVLEKAKATSTYRANRTLAAVRKLFNWAVAKDLVEHSPVAKGMGWIGEEVERERALTFAEVRLVWRAADRIGAPFGPLFKFLLVTAQRRGEVANAKWAGFDTDLELVWKLTAEETKADRAHVVPLSDLALEILAAQPRIEDPAFAEQLRDQGSTRSAVVYVFTTTGGTPLSGFSKAKAELDDVILDIMREDAVAAGRNPDDVTPLEPWRIHDLRRTASTHMEDVLGITDTVVGAVLNHSPKTKKGVTGVYTRGQLLFDRRRALITWARLLQLAVEGGPAWAKVARFGSPKSEAEFAMLDEFRRMAFAEEKKWKAYVEKLTKS